MENILLCSLLSEEEILITYYEDGYLLSIHMTVVGIGQHNNAVICTDAFYNKMQGNQQGIQQKQLFITI
ncbi:hypothetical protein EKQ63_00395 (plasmid) [Bacillus sp. BD59S]|nr:hypothetical protein EKQ63_00395 [Bacillus sp. BD59S]